MIHHNFDHIVECAYRKLLPEGDDFLQSSRNVLSGFDDIKTKPPIIGSEYYVVEVMIVSAINFVSVVASNSPLNCLARSSKSKFKGDDGSFEFTDGKSSRLFPYMTDVLAIDSVVVDTFALVSRNDRDDLIAAIHLLGGKVDVNMI